MSDQDSDALSQDDVFDLLSNRRRRFILAYLSEQETPVTLKRLTTQLAGWENGIDVDEVTDQQRKRVYISVYQTHVPRLTDASLITYDSDTGLVELTDNIVTVWRHMPADDPDAPAWERIYVGVACAGLGVHLLGVAGLFPAAVTGLLGGIGVLSALGIRTVYRRRTSASRAAGLVETADPKN